MGKVDMDKEAFAKRLRNLLLSRGISQSDLAAAVWGRTTDKRGFDVAKNRDRISIYLRGAAMPDPPNLKKIADALEMTVHELLQAEGAPAAGVGPTAGDHSPYTTMEPLAGDGKFVFLRLHRKLRPQDAARLIGMAESMAADAEADAGDLVPRLPLGGAGK